MRDQASTSWRARLAETPPQHYCPQCTSLVYHDDSSCRACGYERDAKGWRPLANSAHRWLGKTIAERYLIAQLLGHGASAEVYRAESLNISRPFAVKILHSSQESEVDAHQMHARLTREIEALAQLRNPHIVPIYEAVEIGDQLAIVMDYVEGATLEGLVEHDGALKVRRACELIRQIANGLCEVHDRTMIHRDLKPENIMIQRMPSGDEFVKILDFGAVWLDSDVKLTHGFLGTPMYASPEQILDTDVDYRSDIYALGAIFFYTLTGQPPFDGDNVYEVLRRHIDDMPPRLADVLPSAHFPQPLERLVGSMLAKTPGKRPQHLLEIIRAIDNLYRDGFISDERTDFSQVHEVSEIITLTGASLESPTDDDTPSRDSAFPHLGVEVGQDTGDTSRSPAGQGTVAWISQDRDEPDDDEQDSDEFGESTLFGLASQQQKRESVDFASHERDLTGPKAAILRRRPTNAGQLKALESKRKPSDSVHGEPITGSFYLEATRNSKTSTHNGSTRARLDGVRACTLASARRFGVVDWANRIYASDGREAGYHRLPHVPADDVTAIALSRRDTLLGLDGGAVHWINPTSGDGEELMRLKRREAIVALGLDWRGQRAIAAAASGALYICSRIRRSPFDLAQLGGPIERVALSSDGSILAVVREGVVSVHPLEAPSETLMALEVTFDGVLDMAISADGELLGLLHGDAQVALYHIATSRMLFESAQLAVQPQAICFARDTSELLGLGADRGAFYVRNLQSDKIASASEAQHDEP